MDDLIRKLTEQIKEKEREIKEVSRAERVDLVKLEKLKKELHALDTELANLDTPQNRKVAAENRQSVMDFITNEHQRQDEEDKKVAEDLRLLKEELHAKEKFFKPRDFKETPEVMDNNNNNNNISSSEKAARLIRNNLNLIFLRSNYYPTNDANNSPYIISNNIKFNQEELEKHREEIKAVLNVVAGFDAANIGLLQDGRPWANNSHEVEHLIAMASALGLIQDLNKPKLIDIFDDIEEEKHRR